jgi:hypothetical protein
MFQGQPGYCDGVKLSKDFTSELTQPRDGVRFQAAPPVAAGTLREVAKAAGAHLYTDSEGPVIHAGAGLVLIHSKEGGPCTIRFRSGREMAVTLPSKSSWLFDAATGERLLP